MLISNFDLCKSEWLELVFAKRNKEYGAYYIRQHHNAYMVKAMGIAFLSVTAAFIAGSIVVRSKAVITPLTATVVELATVKPITPPKVEPPKQQPAAHPQSMQEFKVPVVAPDPVATTPPPIADNIPIGPETINIPGSTGLNLPAEGTATGPAETTGIKQDETIHNTTGLDVMPEPFGGAAAWNKFLQKNLRYPGEASEKGISGRVLVTFVVEKDGHLSSIMVDRGAGYGMDEEAVRVLKLAKAWKPGMASGHLVRVKYVLPFNFTLNEQ
ncbi:MAG: TonB family protein [Mucilaginibacter sp.]